MEPEPPRVRRKLKFAPKAPIRRKPKAEVKPEAVENDDDAQAKDLLRRFNENNMKGKLKVEKKAAHVQVAFGVGGASNSLKSFGFPKSNAGTFTSGLKKEEDYTEPWDYYGYYPQTLPLRRPYSGNPELLDEVEFGTDSETIAYDEDLIKPATGLDLIEEKPEANMFFLQLPQTMPMIKRSPNVKGEGAANSSRPSSSLQTDQRPCSLNELPAGFMGKMLVYKSGAVKLKLGETLYDVSPGMDCSFAQDVVAINTEEKQCCVLGELNKRAILTPDVDFILNSLTEL